MGETGTPIIGRLEKISGPVCLASGLETCGLYDLVEVGPYGLIGEIIRFQGPYATIQVYEDNTGLKIGDGVLSRGEALGVDLGPGLLGSIFDGIQRPLRDLFDREGAFLKPGSRQAPLDREKLFDFTPLVTPPCGLVPGQVWATVREGATLVHKLTVPPRFPGKKLVSLRGPGTYNIAEVLGTTEEGATLTMVQRWPVRSPRPNAGRLATGEPLLTGLRVIDTFFPIAKGGSAAIPGGFGTGKTMTQQAVAKGCDADIIVYVGCGERGNEMTDVLSGFPELVDPRTGRSLMERTILIANTSNMPVAAREVSIYTGVTLAEYYRDMGLHVALLADSTSRWAEALRELGGRLEEMPAEEGFPAYLPTRLAEFYERGGLVKTLSGETGSVTLIGAVSPPGGDFSEPVTQHTRRFIRCFWALDRDLANARHYPAIGWLDSYSDYVNDIAPWWKKTPGDWAGRRVRALEILKEEQKLLEIVRLVGSESLPPGQKLVLATADLLKTGFLQQNTYDQTDRFCAVAKQAVLLDLILKFHDLAADRLAAQVSLASILALPVREVLARAKSQLGDHDMAPWEALAQEMDAQFAGLDKSMEFREEPR